MARTTRSSAKGESSPAKKKPAPAAKKAAPSKMKSKAAVALPKKSNAEKIVTIEACKQ
jgi:hypothetical protein